MPFNQRACLTCSMLTVVRKLTDLWLLTDDPFDQSRFARRRTDKFWTRRGAEALLQLKADTLSDTAPLDKFWRERHKRMTGCKIYQKSKT